MLIAEFAILRQDRTVGKIRLWKEVILSFVESSCLSDPYLSTATISSTSNAYRKGFECGAATVNSSV
jgi:hypothetical protein